MQPMNYPMNRWIVGVAAGTALFAACSTAQSPQSTATKGMSFFITSVGSGKGADLGGIEGADRHCQALAKPPAPATAPGAHISARSRPPSRSERRQCARPHRQRPVVQREGRDDRANVDELHSAKNNMTKETALDERGQLVNGRTDEAEQARHPHRLAAGWHGIPGDSDADMTCGNWTKSGKEGRR